MSKISKDFRRKLKEIKMKQNSSRILMSIAKGRKMLIYNYFGENNQEFYIKLLDSSDEGKSYYDTEGAKVEEIIFKGSKGYIWQTNEMNYLIWHQDGIECHIVGNLNKDEILKVAKNILK